jgi:transcriptional regulator with XRE-family HTH domain
LVERINTTKKSHVEWSQHYARSLRKLRRERYYIQSKLAEATGCTVGRISAVENCHQMPSLALLERIDAELETTFSSQFPSNAVFTPSNELLIFRKRNSGSHNFDTPPGLLWSAQHGQALRLTRMLAGYTAIELSAVLGLHASNTVNLWERCRQAPQYPMLLLIDQVLGTDLHSLFIPGIRIITTRDEQRLASPHNTFKPRWTQADGQRLREARINAGYTAITKFAHALGYARSTISDIERCMDSPSPSLLARVDELIGTSFVEDVRCRPLREQLEATLRNLDTDQEVAS